MSEGPDLNSLRRLELPTHGDATPEAQQSRTAIEASGWRWFLLPYANDEEGVLPRDKFVQIDDVRLLGDGTVVIGNFAFAHREPIKNYNFMGMVASRRAGLGRILQIETSIAVHRFVFTFDAWFQIVPARRPLPRYVYAILLALRILVGFVIRNYPALMSIPALIVVVIIIYLVVKAIVAVIKSDYSIRF